MYMKERETVINVLCLTEGDVNPNWGSIFTVYQKVLI